MKKTFGRLLDRLNYRLVDMLGILVGSVDFTIDWASSRGRPKGTLRAYAREGRRVLGWACFTAQLAKQCPQTKFYFVYTTK